MIYTSRYSNHELWKGTYYAVGISRGRPKFRLGYRLDGHSYKLAPSREAWGRTGEEFDRLYRAGLDGLGPEAMREILGRFELKAKGRDVVLLCFEDVRDPDQRCHRRILADWLKENLGLDVPELPDAGPVKRKNNNPSGQMSLDIINKQ